MTHAHETHGDYAEPALELSSREAEVDLDRVVWDPEYRDEVRELLKRAA